MLGPGDVIQIRVLNEENLDKTVTVTPDGFITYPLLGDLRVDGLTTMQVDAQITSLLARDYLVNPEVILEVVKQRSKKVYIMGAVKQPGYHELPSDQRLLGNIVERWRSGRLLKRKPVCCACLNRNLWEMSPYRNALSNH